VWHLLDDGKLVIQNLREHLPGILTFVGYNHSLQRSAPGHVLQCSIAEPLALE
jgi:hypothetical protein